MSWMSTQKKSISKIYITFLYGPILWLRYAPTWMCVCACASAYEPELDRECVFWIWIWFSFLIFGVKTLICGARFRTHIFLRGFYFFRLIYDLLTFRDVSLVFWGLSRLDLLFFQVFISWYRTRIHGWTLNGQNILWSSMTSTALLFNVWVHSS